MRVLCTICGRGGSIGIKNKVLQKINDKPLTIVGDGKQKRDFIHVYDLVDGLIKIGFSEKSHKDAWELGTGINYSVNDLYNIFKKKFNVDSVNIPDQPGNYRKTFHSCCRICCT